MSVTRSYVHGSSASELDLPRPRPRYRPKPRPGKRVRRSQKPHDVEYVHFDTRRYRIPLPVLLTVFLIFAGGVGTAFSFAYLQDMRQQINRERAAIHQQRAENVATRAEITQHMTVDEISQIAYERLNMGPPDISQIVRIYVPRQSYVQQSYATLDARPEGMWQSAFWYIRNWILDVSQ